MREYQIQALKVMTRAGEACMTVSLERTRGRRRAVQARSKATVERILDAAGALLVEKGADRVTMTEIAQRSGVVIGSLYQYFADRSAIIKALYLRHAAWAKVLLHNLLADVETLEDFIQAMESAFVDYFEVHQRDPLVIAIWSALETDPELQMMDMEDTLQDARMLQRALQGLLPKANPDEVLSVCALGMQFTLSSARFARMAPPEVRRHAPAIGKQIIRDACERLAARSAGEDR
jgi:AcrR family transcriptional regulator